MFYEPLAQSMGGALTHMARDDDNPVQWLSSPEGSALGFGPADLLAASLCTLEGKDHLVTLFLMGGVDRSASTHIMDATGARSFLADAGPVASIACVTSAHFLGSIGYGAADDADRPGYYLAPELSALAEAGLWTTIRGRARSVYRAAKGMELVCETLRLRSEGRLVPIADGVELSMADSVRILAAKKLIADRFREKLTLESIGRACGINRAKLTRGFREVFDCSVAETISEHRLMFARQMLTGSDRPISSVGYDAGYLNNASFARAFHRRFGLPPSEFRAHAKRRAGGLLDSALAA